MSNGRRLPALVAVVAALLALAPALWLWGFTVDDALVSARYAANLAHGHGYRFNAGGAATDGVTPLGWAPLLSLFAHDGVVAAFGAAKRIGLGAWLLGAAALGSTIAVLPTGPRRFTALALLATSAPLAAWSVAGMETGVVLALGAGAAAAYARGRPLVAAACAGLVAGWRPECVLWAFALAAMPFEDEQRRDRLLRVLLSIAPFVFVAAVRWLVFGRPAPLSIYAKPSDLAHGVGYAGACLLVTGPIALVAWRALPRWVRGVQVATAAHLVAIAFAGGDWMVLWRLMVPVVPAVLLAAAWIAGAASLVPSLARMALALAGQLWVLVTGAPAATDVGASRLALIDELRPALAGARAVAALDIGWVGASTSAPIVDLAGITDPAVAALEGGHTSKRVGLPLLQAREVDTLVLLLEPGATVADPWTSSRFSRWVELRVASLDGMARDYAPVAVSEGKLRYVVLRKR